MLKKAYQLRYEVERVVDAGITFAALTVAILIRRELHAGWPEIFPMFDLWPEAGWLYVVLVALWVFILDAMGVYDRKSVHSSAKTIGLLLRANLIGVMLAFFFFYILRIKHVPRALVILFSGLDFFLMWGKELVLRYLEPRWQPPVTLLLVGHPSQFKELMDRIGEIRNWQANIIGFLRPAADREPENGAGENLPSELSEITCLGTTDDLAHILHTESVNYVVLNPDQESFVDVQTTINACETEGVETWLLGSFFKTSIARASVDEFQDLPMLIFSTTPSASWALLLKRVVDLVGSLVLIVLTAPLMLLTAAAIRITSPGPVLFRQKRCTLHGRVFWMYKFRTMITEAEQLRAELDARNEVQGPVFKMSDDPRVTPLGRFLRRYSIDELPQLFNVLNGNMSLVGPRPPIPSEVQDYENWQRRRLSMRPGLTCIWQTTGRNKVGFEQWMKLDLEYIDTWSLGLDFKILLKTPFVVLRGTGV